MSHILVAIVTGPTSWAENVVDCSQQCSSLPAGPLTFTWPCQMWCWSGGREILIKKLSLHYSFVYCYNGAQRYEQFLQVGRLYWALILLGLALCLLSAYVFDLRRAIYIHCVSKKVPLFCKNFDKCRPILIIFSLLYSHIYSEQLKRPPQLKSVVALPCET